MGWFPPTPFLFSMTYKWAQPAVFCLYQAFFITVKCNNTSLGPFVIYDYRTKLFFPKGQLLSHNAYLSPTFLFSLGPKKYGRILVLALKFCKAKPTRFPPTIYLATFLFHLKPNNLATTFNQHLIKH
jgi:hypothetical protein